MGASQSGAEKAVKGRWRQCVVKRERLSDAEPGGPRFRVSVETSRSVFQLQVFAPREGSQSRRRHSAPAERRRSSCGGVGDRKRPNSMPARSSSHLDDDEEIQPAGGRFEECAVDAPVLMQPSSAASWDWPLSRPESKERVRLIERHVGNMERQELTKKLDGMRRLSSGSVQKPLGVLEDSADSWDWPLSRPESKERVKLIEQQIGNIERQELAEKLAGMHCSGSVQKPLGVLGERLLRHREFEHIKC